MDTKTTSELYFYSAQLGEAQTRNFFAAEDFAYFVHELTQQKHVYFCRERQLQGTVQTAVSYYKLYNLTE